PIASEQLYWTSSTVGTTVVSGTPKPACLSLSEGRHHTTAERVVWRACVATQNTFTLTSQGESLQWCVCVCVCVCMCMEIAAVLWAIICDSHESLAPPTLTSCLCFPSPLSLQLCMCVC